MGIRTGGGRMWAESLPPPVLNRLNFEPGVSNRCHDALMMSANLSASAILNIHGVDYRFIINGSSKLLLSYMTMDQDILNIGDIEIKRHNFYGYKSPIDIEDAVPNTISSGKNYYKYFIGYLCDHDKIKPLHKMLPKLKTYVKIYEVQTESMYFSIIKNDDLLNKCNTIWDKGSSDIRKEIHGKLVHKKVFLKAKMKFYNDEATAFHNKGVPNGL